MDSPLENNLFTTLALLTKLYYKPVTEEELVNGLPVDPVTHKHELFSCTNFIDNFSRASKRAGLTSELFERKLTDISGLTLPAILIMKDETGCILDSFDKKRKKYSVVFPDGKSRNVKAKLLEQDYMGYVFLISQDFDHDRQNEEKIEKKKGHWFWQTIWMSKFIYFDVIKASLLTNLFVLASPLFTRNVYDRVIPNNALDTLWALVIGVIVIIFLDAMLKFTRTYFIEIAAKKSDVIISSKMFEHVLSLRPEETPRSIGSFATNFKEFDSIRNFLTSSVTLAFIDMPFTIFFLYVIYYLGGALVNIPIVMICILLLYTMFIKNPLFRSIFSSFQANSKKNSLLIETLNGLNDIKNLNCAGIFQWRWENHIAKIAGIGIKSRMLSFSISTMTSLLIQLNSVLLVTYGVFLIQEKKLTMGGLIAVSILSSRTIAPMGQVVALISNYQQTRVAYNYINEIMKKPTDCSFGQEFIKKDDIEGDIEFRNVTFTYPGSEKAALSDISFKIKKGERIGIIGRTGSGKSTIQKLIIGFYKPDSGSVFIDNLDVSQISPVVLRRNINFVAQDFRLFSGTLRENIIMKTPYADDKAIINATVISGLEPFVKNSPRGFDTFIEERGLNISGGQRQGIAIARAFIRKAPVALLDEPTNSLDGQTEMHVKSCLRKYTDGNTVVLTTHKNTMLDFVERLLVIDLGKLIFSGTPEEVLKKFSGGPS